MQIRKRAMKNFVKLLFVAIVLSSCTEQFALEDGDMLFCVAEDSAMSNAIVDATESEQSLQYDHVAIYASVDGVPSVFEAHPKHGVVCRKFEEFMADAADINGQKGITVMRMKKTGEKHLIDVAAMVERAKQSVGLGYDWSFLPDNGKLYCSELVYECYLDDSGSHVFESRPMSFRDKDGNMPQFWVELFAKNGEEVPEGEPGTNPNDMIKEPIIEEVHRYFEMK